MFHVKHGPVAVTRRRPADDTANGLVENSDRPGVFNALLSLAESQHGPLLSAERKLEVAAFPFGESIAEDALSEFLQ